MDAGGEDRDVELYLVSGVLIDNYLNSLPKVLYADDGSIRAAYSWKEISRLLGLVGSVPFAPLLGGGNPDSQWLFSLARTFSRGASTSRPAPAAVSHPPHDGLHYVSLRPSDRRGQSASSAGPPAPPSRPCQNPVHAGQNPRAEDHFPVPTQPTVPPGRCRLAL